MNRQQYDRFLSQVDNYGLVVVFDGVVSSERQNDLVNDGLAEQEITVFYNDSVPVTN